MKLKPHLNYKDSGHSWIGRIPNEWITEPLKYNTYAKGRIGWQNLRSDEFIDEGPFLVTGMHFTKDQNIDWDNCFHISQDRFEIAPEIQLKLDDVLITKDGTIGKLAYIDFLPGPATLNSHLLVLRPLMKRYISKYLLYVLDSNIFEIFIKLNQSGTTFFGITQEAILNFPMIIPPYAQQQSIVTFLDRETGKLDNLISKQERLIELLQEKRQTVISHSVTKGLDPDAKMKDSGVEWLGMVPEHWDVCAIKHICDVRDGTHETPEYVDGGEFTYPLVTSKDLVSGKVVLVDAKHISESDFTAISKRSGVNQNDLLMPMIGTVGGAVIVETAEKFAIKNVALFKAYGGTSPRWLSYGLNSEIALLQFDLARSGGVQGFVALGVLRNLVLPFPPFDEQNNIYMYLDKESSKIDILINKAKRSIELAKEHRTVLISAAVTGKIDVREAA